MAHLLPRRGFAVVLTKLNTSQCFASSAHGLSASACIARIQSVPSLCRAFGDVRVGTKKKTVKDREREAAAEEAKTKKPKERTPEKLEQRAKEAAERAKRKQEQR